jgi:hypothetical protein
LAVVSDSEGFDRAANFKYHCIPAGTAPHCAVVCNRASTPAAIGAVAAVATTTIAASAAVAAVAGVAGNVENSFDVTAVTSLIAVSAESRPPVSAFSAGSAVRANNKILGVTACSTPAVTTSHNPIFVVYDRNAFEIAPRLKQKSGPAGAAYGIFGKRASTETAGAAVSARAASTITTSAASAAVAGVAGRVDSSFDDTTVPSSTAAFPGLSNASVSALSAGSAVSANIKIEGETACSMPAATASHSAVVCDQRSFDFTTR